MLWHKYKEFKVVLPAIKGRRRLLSAFSTNAQFILAVESKNFSSHFFLFLLDFIGFFFLRKKAEYLQKKN
jgi:hypothetical protein